MVGFSCCHPLIPCQALGQALVSSSIKGEGDSVGWVVLYRPVLWIADQVRNDVIGTLFPCRLDSRLRGNDGDGRGNDGGGTGILGCAAWDM